jgi:glutamine amidotransferase
MCRLYGLDSTHPTKIGCELVEAQNSLIRQSVQDERGSANPHGWGIGYVMGQSVSQKRQVQPASESEAFRKTAINTKAPSVLAHVRRATVGKPELNNTHPFQHENSLLAHNGHIGNFEQVKPRLLDNMDPELRGSIKGSTDSEHIFYLLLTRRRRRPNRSPMQILRDTILDIEDWTEAEGRDPELALNLLWLVDGELAGARFNRSLWYIERDEPHVCSICGEAHADPNEDEEYHVAEFASEQITDEGWTEVPDETVFQTSNLPDLTMESLRD